MGSKWALFGFSEIWQLVINTSTSIVTFLMVFLLQDSQNRALQAKLDELILSGHAANRYVGTEKLNEKELRDLSMHLAEHAQGLDDKADDSLDHRKA